MNIQNLIVCLFVFPYSECWLTTVYILITHRRGAISEVDVSLPIRSKGRVTLHILTQWLKVYMYTHNKSDKCGSGTDRVSPDAMVLSLSEETIGRSLPLAESLSLVVVDLHWPVQWHLQYIKHGPVPTAGSSITLTTYRG